MKLALIGVGLIGGSFARALRAAGKVDSIVGFDGNAEAIRRALELNVIDEHAATAAQAVDQANLVMIATPVGSAHEILRAIAQHLSSGAIITDVGSTKSSVIDAARAQLGAAFSRFVPGHPIAGREHSGVENSDAALFRDHVFVSTPVEQTSANALDHVEALWRSLGCRIERMTPDEHDNIFAAVSHLPHMLAFALVAQIAIEPDAQQKFAMAGPGFRDFTRIAASDPTLWADICIANRHALAGELNAYRASLDQLQHAVESADAPSMQQIFERAAMAMRAVGRSG